MFGNSKQLKTKGNANESVKAYEEYKLDEKQLVGFSDLFGKKRLLQTIRAIESAAKEGSK